MPRMRPALRPWTGPRTRALRGPWAPQATRPPTPRPRERGRRVSPVYSSVTRRIRRRPSTIRRAPDPGVTPSGRRRDGVLRPRTGATRDSRPHRPCSRSSTGAVTLNTAEFTLIEPASRGRSLLSLLDGDDAAAVLPGGPIPRRRTPVPGGRG